jgi:hypothetical protein
LLSKTHATRGVCDALVRPYGNGALSTCSIVKLSPKQTTGSNALPTVTTRNWNDVFNTVRIISAEQYRVDWIWLLSRALGLRAWHMIVLLLKCHARKIYD